MFKNDDFVEASAYLRVLEKRMLNSGGMSRILEAKDASETLKQISQNSEADFSSLKKVEDYEEVLKDGLKKTYELMYKLSPRREVIDVTAAKYVFHNLKVALKSEFAGLNMSRLYSDIPDIDMTAAEALVSGAADDEKGGELPDYFKKAALEAKSAFEESRDPQDIDIVCDRHMFERMLSLCGKIENGLITEYVKTSIDFHNIKTLIRVKNMNKGSRFLGGALVQGGLTDVKFFLEHYDKSSDAYSSVFYYKYFGDAVKRGMESFVKTGNYGALEKVFDNRLIEIVKNAKFSAFGPDVPFAYVISKENELRQIRLLVAGKYNGMRSEDLKERMRDNYA